MTSIYRKVFSRAFRSHWDRENRWIIDGDMAEWSLWHEEFSYIYSPFKVAASRSNSSGLEKGIEVCLVDVSRGGWMLSIVLRNEVQCLDVGDHFPRVVLSAETCKGTTLGWCLVIWVGSHLRADVSLIAFSCLSYFPFCDNSCEPSKSIKGQYVNICQEL